MRVNVENKAAKKVIVEGDFVRLYFKENSLKYPNDRMYLAVKHPEYAGNKLSLISLDGTNSQGAVGVYSSSLEERLANKSFITHYEIFSKEEYSITLNKGAL